MTRRRDVADALMLAFLILFFTALGIGAWRESQPQAQLETVVVCQTPSTCHAVKTWVLK